MIARSLAIASLAVLVAACDPGYSIRAVVRDEEGTPIPGATLTAKDCARPGDATTTTGAAPQRVMGGLGVMDRQCRFELAAEGFEPRTVPLAEVCRQRSSMGCHEADIDVKLRRRSQETP